MSLKSNIFSILVDTPKTELYGIMGTATSHEFYPIRYMSSLIQSHIDANEIEAVSDNPKLVQLIELYSEITATYATCERGQETGISSLIKKL